MNKRLDTIYTNIASDNSDKFLNNELILDDTWSQSIWGVTLQIDLSEQARDKLVEIQRNLDDLEPDNFLLLPREYQHISFNQVVFWGGEYAKGRESTWESIKEKFTQSFLSQDGKYTSFEVAFTRLIPTAGAIIWCADDVGDSMENLRNVFLEELPFPEETTRLNHIVHTTVARYKNYLNNPQKVADYLSKEKAVVSMQVSKIVLRNELVFPSIKTKDLAEINLNSPIVLT